MILLLTLLLNNPEQKEIDRRNAAFFKPGQSLWVSGQMAEGYGLPFGKKLTIKKARVMFMNEARVVFKEIPDRRFYLRTDFGPSYAFKQDPRTAGLFTPEEWSAIRQRKITVGMEKRIFLCIKPRPEEVSYRTNVAGPIEQWIYREKPRSLYGMGAANPPSQIYYFQNDILIWIM